MSKINVLISGGGIAGPCVAWWLNKGIDAKVTIIERAPEARTTGQAVDIRKSAVDIIKRMGLVPLIQSKTTTEEGLAFVYADGETKAVFPATGDEGNQGFTSEYEILRGDLAQIFYDATKELVEYVFDEYVTAIEEQGNGKAKVTFANHLQPTEYDLVIGADGMTSKTRRIVWGKGPDENDYLKPLGQYCSFFTIPRIDSDTKIAQWYNAPKGRLAAFRPDQYGQTRAYLAVTDTDLSRFEGIKKAMGEGQAAQQKWLEDEFVGAGWQTPRLVEGMKKSTDFYMSQIAQVKLDSFTKGKVALLGDSGYCPSPISGMGTSAAIIGAYVLAGEISNSPADIPKALEQYHATLKPFVDSVQKIVPGAPHIANPQTKLGITLLNSFTGVASNKWVKRIASTLGSAVPTSLFPDLGGGDWSPPKYPALAV